MKKKKTLWIAVAEKTGQRFWEGQCELMRHIILLRPMQVVLENDRKRFFFLLLLYTGHTLVKRHIRHS